MTRRALVVTYSVPYVRPLDAAHPRAVDLCDRCVAAGDHDAGALGAVEHGRHSGWCEGARHGLPPIPERIDP